MLTKKTKSWTKTVGRPSIVQPLKGFGRFGRRFVQIVQMDDLDDVDDLDESTVCMVINPHHKGDFFGAD